jgi:galactonate dehydratase
MKITDIKSYPTFVNFRNQFILKIETDEGFFGLGESGVSGRELAVKGAVDHFRKFLIGRDPTRIGALWQEMYRSQYFEGGRILAGAISAVDIALHDLVARKLDIPVYQLLGGAHRDLVPGFPTVGVPLSDADVIPAAQRFIDEGWNVLRFVPAEHQADDTGVFEPRESIATTAQWLVAVREALGNGPTLGIDYHHRLSVAEAASFCQRLPEGTLDFLEEPIRAESPEAYAALRGMTNIPFAIGEEFASKWAFLPFVERGLTNFARVDVCNIGGFTEAMKVAGWCEAHYIDMMPHNPLGPISTAAHVHFSAAVPNFSWLEVRTGTDFEVSQELFPVQLSLDGPGYPVPAGPGLGVEFNEEAALELGYRDWEAPHLRRRDGSYTNW